MLLTKSRRSLVIPYSRGSGAAACGGQEGKRGLRWGREGDRDEESREKKAPVLPRFVLQVLLGCHS